MPVWGAQGVNPSGSDAFGNRQAGGWNINPDIPAEGSWNLKAAQASAAPGLLAAENAQTRFNTAFPWLQSQFSALSSHPMSGSSWPRPNITVGGVWNPQQIQAQVNQTRAQNDQGMASQNLQAKNQLAGSGFGANSPLLQAIYGQNFASNLGTNAQAETQLRTTAAQQNAGQLLSTQQARENQFATAQQEQIARQRNLYGILSPLLGAIGGIV